MGSSVIFVGSRPSGSPEKILHQNPHDRRGRVARTPAPMCHASSKQRFWAYADSTVPSSRSTGAASEAFRSGALAALEQFPPGCFRPGFAPVSIRVPDDLPPK